MKVCPVSDTNTTPMHMVKLNHFCFLKLWSVSTYQWNVIHILEILYHKWNTTDIFQLRNTCILVFNSFKVSNLESEVVNINHWWIIQLLILHITCTCNTNYECVKITSSHFLTLLSTHLRWSKSYILNVCLINLFKFTYQHTHLLDCFKELMKTTYNICISYFQLTSISSPRQFMKTAYTLYKSNSALFIFCKRNSILI